VDPQKGNTCEILHDFDLDSLHDFFEKLLDQYLEWLLMQVCWRKKRDDSLRRLDFPYHTYRGGQRAMAVEVYRTIRDNKQLMAQAATGIGKTMAAVFPAVKALGEQLITKVIFLTARTTGRLAAEAAFDLLRKHGACLKTLSLTAKEKICFNPQIGCDPELCEYAKGFYDRINTAMAAAFAVDALERSRISSIAREFKVCPFELSLEMVNWVDGIIGDYNYAFDPNVMLKRLFLENHDRHAVLVDEAHNLVDRAREMFSAQLGKESVLALRRSLKPHLPGLYRQLGKVNTALAAARRRCREAGGQLVEAAPPQALIEHLIIFLRSTERWLMKNIKASFREELLTLFFDCMRFVRVAETYDRHYATLLESLNGNFKIKLYCLDPSLQLKEAWSRCCAAVLFSATLTPAEYFITVLGCARDTGCLNLPSPFSAANLGVFVAPHLSTYFRDRKASCKDISDAIAALVRCRVGNYFVFFPSYEYLNLIHAQFTCDYPEIATLVQTTAMDENQRELFLEQFSETLEKSLVAFGIMGGIFGEGIDLKGDRLTAAIIVGVGLPGIGLERELIREYYNHVNEKGFAFAYQYPGINRVMQAAGRVIRSEQDRGVILLIDRRYAQSGYRELLPAHWQLRWTAGADALQSALAGFWGFCGNR
jgi:DNA excision repair protein ERCC-2